MESRQRPNGQANPAGLEDAVRALSPLEAREVVRSASDDVLSELAGLLRGRQGSLYLKIPQDYEWSRRDHYFRPSWFQQRNEHLVTSCVYSEEWNEKIWPFVTELHDQLRTVRLERLPWWIRKVVLIDDSTVALPETKLPAVMCGVLAALNSITGWTIGIPFWYAAILSFGFWFSLKASIFIPEQRSAERRAICLCGVQRGWLGAVAEDIHQELIEQARNWARWNQERAQDLKNAQKRK